MKTLYVLYDRDCALCRRCRQWLENQPAYLDLRFVALQSEEVPGRFPGIAQFHPDEQLLVISDDGAVYSGPSAWIMCLYALRQHRAWSQRLAGPLLLPMAKRVCELLSENRLTLSTWFGIKSERDLHEAVVRHGAS